MSDTDIRSGSIRPGSSPFTPSANAPRWFLDNLKQPGASRYASSNGRRVHFLAWNWEDESLPVLILVHGFSGHAHWWSFLAPFFTDRYRIAAIDLPGMGDSEAPAEYTHRCFSQAILDLLRQYHLQQVTIVGHSFGGVQTMHALAAEPQRFKHGIIVDSYVKPPSQEPIPRLQPRGKHRVTASRQECMERFRLIPPQPHAMAELLQFVSYHSCIEGEEGWHWKFDPDIINYGELDDPSSLATASAKVDCIYGEHSMFNADNLPRRVLEYFPNHGRLIIIPGAYHHIMLDHPLELVAAITELLADI